jgi:hypothetical protein
LSNWRASRQLRTSNTAFFTIIKQTIIFQDRFFLVKNRYSSGSCFAWLSLDIFLYFFFE